MMKLGEGKIFVLVTEEIGSGLLLPVDACKRDGLYRGADKSLDRPTSRCIFLMVRMFLLMLVLLYIYMYIYIYIYVVLISLQL